LGVIVIDAAPSTEFDMASPSPRVQRDIGDLVQSLRAHVDQLREYADRAFNQTQEGFLGEVAGKFRLLVYEWGRNTPLLLKLMDVFGVTIPITINKPRGTIQLPSLRGYLDELAFVHRLTGGELAEYTKKQVIGAWSQQMGASHEDWQVEELLLQARDPGLRIGGLPGAVHALRSITRTVLFVADEFLVQLTPEVIEQKRQQLAEA
jgi:hypothetical protein